MFLEDLGLEESGLEKLIKASYRLLGLISYLTAGEPEVRAWTKMCIRDRYQPAQHHSLHLRHCSAYEEACG